MIQRRGIFFTAIPATMVDGNIRLRPLRISDGVFLKTGLSGEESLRANGLVSPVSASGRAILRWIKRTYDLAWCIEIDLRPAGFAGIFRLRPGESAEASLMFFDSGLRRCGYGGRVFRMIAETLAVRIGIKRISVRVRTDNGAALSFWKKMGFEHVGSQDDASIMEFDTQAGSALKI